VVFKTTSLSPRMFSLENNVCFLNSKDCIVFKRHLFGFLVICSFVLISSGGCGDKTVDPGDAPEADEVEMEAPPPIEKRKDAS